MTPTRIGLLGGSFDPIHFGHLVMAEEARVQLGLEKVIFLTAGVPPHKVGRRVLSGPQHRLAMTRLATASNPHFEVSDYELGLGSAPTYTIDTLRYFQRLLAPAEVGFILGMDSFLEIHTWKDHLRFLDHGHLIVATRAGYDASRMEKDVPRALLERRGEGGDAQQPFRVFTIEIPPVATSSTELRERCRKKAATRYLVPDAVWHYIQKEGLYLPEPSGVPAIATPEP